VRILDTLNLERFLVSEGCVGAVDGMVGDAAFGQSGEVAFDGMGNLLEF
jgi:hypothetical protein